MKLNKRKGNLDEVEHIEGKKGKKGLLIVLGIVGLIVVLFLVLGLIMRFTVNKNNNPPQIIEENLAQGNENNVDESIEEIPIEGLDESEVSLVDEEIEEPVELPLSEYRMDYESKIIGIGFNYDTDMYLEENTDRVFNVLKQSSNGKDNFNILEDKVVEDLEIMTLKYQGNDKLLVTLSLKEMGEEFEFNKDSINEYINNIYKLEVEEVEEEIENTNKSTKGNKKNNSKHAKVTDGEIEEIEEVIDNRKLISSFVEITPIQEYNSSYSTFFREYLIVDSNKTYKVIRGYSLVGVNIVELVVQTEGELDGVDTYGIFENILDSLVVLS